MTEIFMQPWFPWVAFMVVPLGLVIVGLCIYYIRDRWKDRLVIKLKDRVCALEERATLSARNTSDLGKYLEETRRVSHDNLQQQIRSLRDNLTVEKRTLERASVTERAKTHRFDLEIE